MKNLLLILALFVGSSFAKDVGLYCFSTELIEREYILSNGEISFEKPLEYIDSDKTKEIFLIMSSSNKTFEEISFWVLENIKKVSFLERGLKSYEWSHIVRPSRDFKDITWKTFKNNPASSDTASSYKIDRENLILKLEKYINWVKTKGIKYQETYQCEINNKKVFDRRDSVLEKIKLKQLEQKSNNKI